MGDEEDGESNDARNSSKKRRRGTILKLTHRRIDYFGPQLLSHYYIKMRRRISRRHGDAKQARENRFLFPRKPETEVNRENPLLYHPNRASKEEEWRTQTGSGRVRTPKRS